jgi:hypothetical protein
MITLMLGLASMLAVFALGFVLGRVWEIRQDMRPKAKAQSAQSTRMTKFSQLNDRFWGEAL